MWNYVKLQKPSDPSELIRLIHLYNLYTTNQTIRNLPGHSSCCRRLFEYSTFRSHLCSLRRSKVHQQVNHGRVLQWLETVNSLALRLSEDCGENTCAPIIIPNVTVFNRISNRKKCQRSSKYQGVNIYLWRFTILNPVIESVPRMDDQGL